MKHTTREARSE